MGAPKGNQYAIGNKGGHPPFYKDKDELEWKCDEYFYVCKNNNEYPTITGLALHLGFSTRKSLIDYEGKEEFIHVIKRAKLKVESSYEQRLYSTQPTGAIFALKNMDWSDKSEHDITSKGESINKTVDYSTITTEELIKRSEAIRQIELDRQEAINNNNE